MLSPNVVSPNSKESSSCAKAAGEAPNAVTYSTLINACGRAGQLERAFADGGLPSVGDVARSVYDEEGPDVLFSGGFERVLRSAPQFGVTLALYDVLTQYFVDHGWLG